MRSTSETSIVGTRTARPSNLPLSSGNDLGERLGGAGGAGDHADRGRARAAQVALAVRACRGCAWSLVYEWTVVIRPRLTPKLSSMTLAMGARQLVVHEPFEMTLWFFGVVLVVVHAEHDRDVVALGGRADDDLLGAGVDVRARPCPCR